MDSDQYIINQLINKFISQPVLIRGLIVADIQHYNPQDIFSLADMATNANGNKECYILTPPRRFVFVLPWFPVHRARNGYWKKDGYTDLEIYGNNGIVGVKQKFHFYEGGINNGRKTNWYMIEYSLKEHCCSVTCDHENGRLENWVVCKIYQDFGPDHLTSEIQKLNI